MTTTAPPATPTAPTVPDRADRSTFPTRMYSFFVYMVGTFTTYMADIASNAYANANDAYASANASAASATASANSATAAASSANYHGEWSTLTGAANVPYSVSHLGKFWSLASNLADITTKTPGTDPEWLAVTPTNYQVKTTTYTAADGDQIAADTSGGAFTITLPASPVAGKTRVDFRDYARTFASNPLTVGRNGKLIEGIAEDMVCYDSGDSFGLVFVNDTKGWLNI